MKRGLLCEGDSMAARLRPGKAAGRGVSRARRMPSEPVLLAGSPRALPPRTAFLAAPHPGEVQGKETTGGAGPPGGPSAETPQQGRPGGPDLGPELSRRGPPGPPGVLPRPPR